ncbi:hypothetical protein OH809_04065 [Streptomyces sp. NBC_00873]|uniref:hypothetical protein n=1 Tax=unclassified Streptomyces TaxID=2593676 RepID=UPI00386E697C|nr:hypothetical protein OH809_04065 [Streptomyces sp. NBC_00873]WTA47966.1 hypothetical protein OH821_39735 [Streptomyces sp. NBC_00842]
MDGPYRKARITRGRHGRRCPRDSPVGEAGAAGDGAVAVGRLRRALFVAAGQGKRRSPVGQAPGQALPDDAGSPRPQDAGS